jgi:hypothetical protein
MDTKPTFLYYAHTANHWAAGNSIVKTLKSLRNEAGANWVKDAGYQIVAFTRPVTLDEFNVHPVDGRLSVAEGVRTEIVEMMHNEERRKQDASDNK